jgi:hypothetical protein
MPVYIQQEAINRRMRAWDGLFARRIINGCVWRAPVMTINRHGGSIAQQHGRRLGLAMGTVKDANDTDEFYLATAARGER